MIPEEILRRLKFDKKNGDRNQEIRAVKSIEYDPYACPDCNKTLTQQRVIQTVLYPKPKPHWRRHCKLCQLWRDPNTGEFSVENSRIHQLFATFLRNR